MGPTLLWFGHDAFCIRGSKTIYIDPFKLEKRDHADIILITHTHYDHCSPEDIAKVMGPATALIGPADALKKYPNCRVMKPGETLEVEGIGIDTVPAYNIDKQFHPKANQWLGFVITIDGERIYHAGDTDRIPEMKLLRNIDIALLPVSGTYVMTSGEAALAAMDFMPKKAVPMHYGSVVGGASDADSFKAGLSGKIPVEILKKQ